MNKPGLAFVSTSKQTTFRNLVRVLLYGHVVHVSSCSLVLVSRHERIATVGDFYTGNTMQWLGVQLFYFNSKTVPNSHEEYMVAHIHLNKSINIFSL
jgi:hypothetical protein